MPTSRSSIRLSNVSVDFDGHFMLHSINWVIHPEQHWVIVGANGTGKSALAATLLGGGTLVAGNVSGVPQRIGVVSFEAQAALIDAERKKDDADLLDVISTGTPVREILAASCVDAPLQARLIDAFRFHHLLEQSFRKLSSGETRKVLLIRALCSQPQLLILDEPFDGLDAQAQALLHDLLVEIAREVQLIMVLNRFDEIPEFATHIAYMGASMGAYTGPCMGADPQTSAAIGAGATRRGACLQHQIARSDAQALADLRQLLHLQTTDLQIPHADAKPRRPNLQADEPLVRLRKATIAYGNKTIFSALDWSIHAGEHWQVTGPNGCGKTCLLNLITGDHPQCYVNDIRVFGMQRGTGESIWDIKQYIGYVSSALQWEYKVSVSVRNAIISGFYDSIGIYQKYTEVQRDIADQWLALLDMTSSANRPFNELSFGDQRLILIARAMVKHPPLLILDEPCLGLDDLNRQLVLALIEKICAGRETTVLYVNHRPEDKIEGIDQHLAMALRAV